MLGIGTNNIANQTPVALAPVYVRQVIQEPGEITYVTVGNAVVVQIVNLFGAILG